LAIPFSNVISSAWKETFSKILAKARGAVSRVGEDETAYGHRTAGHAVNINAGWLDGDKECNMHVRWAQDLWSALAPYGSGSAYANFLGDEGEDRARAAYGEQKYARLVQLKSKYDPTNFFRMNQNIRPTSGEAR
jgi:hypothetical protein